MKEGALHEQLPGGWVWTRFDEVIEKIPITDRKLKQSDYQQKGKFPVIDQGQEFIGGYTDNEDLKICCESPVIVFGDHTKVFKYVNFDFVAGADGIKVIKPNRSFSPKLFYNFIQIIQLPDKGYARHFQFLEKSFVPLPPLPEQRAIVSKLEQLFSDLDNGIDNFKKAQAQLKLYRQSVLKAACEGKLVPTEAELARAEGRDYEAADELLARILKERREKLGRVVKNNESNVPDTSGLPELAEGWVLTNPATLSTFENNAICAGPFGTIFKAKDFRSSGIPIIFLRHVGAGSYLTHKPTFMDEVKWNELFKEYSVYGGELLITKLGEPPGVCAIYPNGIGPAMVTPDVMKMTVNEDAAHPRFLMYYFNSNSAKTFASGSAFGTTRLRLTLPIFRNMPIPLPPLAEQRRIVAEVERRLSVTDKMEATIAESLQKAESLRQSILKKAFEGKLLNKKELEIARNSSDWEPAEKLLERIRQEKQIKEKNNKPARRRTHG